MLGDTWRLLQFGPKHRESTRHSIDWIMADDLEGVVAKQKPRRTVYVIACLLTAVGLSVAGKLAFDQFTIARLCRSYVESQPESISGTDLSDYEVFVFAPKLIRLHRELSDLQRPFPLHEIVSSPEKLGIFNMRNNSWGMLYVLHDRDERIAQYMRLRCEAKDLFEDEVSTCDLIAEDETMSAP
jgi:hypothetical protein